MRTICSSLCRNAAFPIAAIPLYRLARAQASVRQRRAGIRHYRVTPLVYVRIVDACKLYDSAVRRWTDFAGRPAGHDLESISYVTKLETR